MARRTATKRARQEQASQGPSESGECAFACSVTPSAGVLRISFELPTEVVASSPVLSAMTSMNGNDTAVQQSSARLLAWLAWHANQHSQVHGGRGDLEPQALQWDGEVDAFNVRQPKREVSLCLYYNDLHESRAFCKSSLANSGPLCISAG